MHLAVLLVLALLTYRLSGNPNGVDIQGSFAKRGETVFLESIVVETSPTKNPSESVDSQSKVDVAMDSADVAAAVESRVRSVTLETVDTGTLKLGGGTPSPSMMVYLGGGGMSARTPEGRTEVGRKYGATAASEQAVENALRWLADHQRADGSWSFDLRLAPCEGRCRHGRPDGEDTPTPATAATGLALLAFMGAGYTSQEGKYTETVRRGIYYLRSVAAETQFGYDWQQGGSMYGHGIALMAMSEALGMNKLNGQFDTDLFFHVKEGSRFTVHAQHPSGSWGYTPGSPGDTTITGWQLLSLVGAHKAGIQMPSGLYGRVREYLFSVRDESTYGFGYRSAEPRPTTTAIALTLMMYLGQAPGNTNFDLAVDRMAKAGPSATNVYHNYYATLALHHFRHRRWDQWNSALQDHLIRTQATEGHEAGSWHFKDRWGDVGGRVYTTAMCALTLEVYYRFLPLYEAPPGFPATITHRRSSPLLFPICQILVSASKTAIIVVIIAIVGLIVLLGRDSNSDVEDAQALMRKQNARERMDSARSASNARGDLKAAFDALAAEGKAMPVPETLVVNPDPSGFWFVGRPDQNVGVEVPFAPGRTRTPPPEHTAISENPGFLGADACQECHQERHASFIHTAHYRTSLPADEDSIAGSLDDGRNVLTTENPNVQMQMLQRDDQCYQRVEFLDWMFEVPMDIAIGSAKIGQSYLYWHEDGLYQANVAYLAEGDTWINSPGYIDGDAAYARPIGTRCLECHTTYVELRKAENHYTPASMIFGISCERCHGPGRDHVEYHRQNPSVKTAESISKPTDFSRQQQLDICGQCHFGAAELKGDAYQFRPGDALSDHYLPDDQDSDGGVHTSNQLERLQMTPCFTETEMTCIDCHDPHQKERGNTKLFSKRCLNCHQTAQCGMEPELGERLSDNCIDCHMPSRASDKLWMKTKTGKVFPPLRDHHVRVDPEATARYLRSLMKK